MGTIGILIVVVGFGLAYGLYFHRRAQIANAGGLTPHSRAHLTKTFQLPADEQVTAAWSAITVPKLSKGQKATEIAGAAAAVIVGVGVRYVGRELGLAFTTKNRLVILDKDDGAVRAFAPSGKRPVFSETGKSGTKRTSQTKFGWVDGAIVKMDDGVDDDGTEIDIVASAVPVLVGWSRGDDASRLDGPYPVRGTL